MMGILAVAYYDKWNIRFSLKRKKKRWQLNLEPDEMSLSQILFFKLLFIIQIKQEILEMGLTVAHSSTIQIRVLGSFVSIRLLHFFLKSLANALLYLWLWDDRLLAVAI